MDFFQPGSLKEALEIKRERPEAVPLAGGTDVMVELNFDRRRPDAIVDLTRVPELHQWSSENGRVRLGAGVTYSAVIAELASDLPGLAIASRTVGSPQIRNRGTIGGNLGTCSPAGDALPPLVAVEAQVELTSTRGTRLLRLGDFMTGPKRNALEPDELISAASIPRARGPQQFSKIGTRNAMVIAVASFALAVDAVDRKIGTGIGSAGPVILRASEAESWLEGVLEQDDLWESRREIKDSAADRFGELVAQTARPIDDVRGSARYRHHAVAVMARRTLSWAWDDYRRRL